MRYKNTKTMVRSPKGDTDFFEIVAGVLQGDTLATYLFIIWLDYILRTPINLVKKWLYAKKKKKKKKKADDIPQKLIDVDCADDKALLANTPAQAESLLHSRDQAAGGINLHLNANKTE